MVSPAGGTADSSWANILAGKSSARKVTEFEVDDLPAKIACQIPRGDEPDAWNPDDWMEVKEQRKVDNFIMFGLAAAQQAVEDACWTPEDRESLERTGVLIGSGTRPTLSHPFSSTAGSILANVPTAPDIAPVAISARASRIRDRLRSISA